VVLRQEPGRVEVRVRELEVAVEPRDVRLPELREAIAAVRQAFAQRVELARLGALVVVEADARLERAEPRVAADDVARLLQLRLGGLASALAREPERRVAARVD